MNIKAILTITFISVAVFVKAQDRIITSQNDTINCKISKVNSSNIFFTIKTGNVLTKGKIEREKVLNYYSDNTTVENDSGFYLPESSRWRLGLTGGFNYLTASSSKAETAMIQQGISKENAESYYDNLKPGIGAGADLHYMITKMYGIGLVYKFYQNNSKIESFFNPNDGLNLMFGQMSEKIYVNYAGVSFYSEQFLKANPRLKLSSYYSMGMAFYRDEAVIVNSPFLLTGKAFATNLDLGLEYFVFPRISAGINVSYFLSSLKKITLNDGNSTITKKLEKEEFENISRLDLSFGIRFYR
ncbi:MAG TPA: hypothetical protein DHV48_18130 [Prolixibacteraceae bacterium]|nr:hypothetical protein [Prolixibacteraceae bacterium]